MRKSNEQPLKEVINKLLEVYKLQDKLKEVRLISTWEKVMGKVIAIRTKELYIKDRKFLSPLILHHCVKNCLMQKKKLKPCSTLRQGSRSSMKSY